MVTVAKLFHIVTEKTVRNIYRNKSKKHKRCRDGMPIILKQGRDDIKVKVNLQSLVVGILFLEILVPWTRIFTGNYILHLLKNPSRLKTLVLGLVSRTGEYNTTANQQRESLGNSQHTLRSPKHNYRLLQWQASQPRYCSN